MRLHATPAILESLRLPHRAYDSSDLHPRCPRRLRARGLPRRAHRPRWRSPVVVPALTLALGVDIKYAIGASLVSVIATSSGAAAAYVREGYSNIRIGMLLEIATTLGALAGAVLAARVTTHAIAIVFGLVLLQAAYQSFKPDHGSGNHVESDTLGRKLRPGR